MSTEQLLLSLLPHERSYYDDLKKLTLQDVERQLAALLLIKERFIGTARVESLLFACSCIQLCQHVILEHAAHHGLALSEAMAKGIELHVRADVPLVCDAAQSLSATMAAVTNNVDTELDTRIAHHRAIAGYSTQRH